MEQDREDRRALDAALAAARRAGEALLARHGRLDPRTIRSKSSRRDLVSEADLASEKILLEELGRAFPADRLQAEESKGAPSGAGGSVWFLDPLDGTTNFVHGLPEFTVSIARFVDEEPRVAVVHAPRLAETFFARKGGGAWRRTATGEEAPIRVSVTTALEDALVATGFPYRRSSPADDNAANFTRLLPRVRDLRRLGSAALDLAFVACGRFDAYWELRLEPHDVAAGGLLVLEAGGTVTEIGGGPRWPRGHSILASNGPLHALFTGLLTS